MPAISRAVIGVPAAAAVGLVVGGHRSAGRIPLMMAQSQAGPMVPVAVDGRDGQGELGPEDAFAVGVELVVELLLDAVPSRSPGVAEGGRRRGRCGLLVLLAVLLLGRCASDTASEEDVAAD